MGTAEGHLLPPFSRQQMERCLSHPMGCGVWWCLSAQTPWQRGGGSLPRSSASRSAPGWSVWCPGRRREAKAGGQGGQGRAAALREPRRGRGGRAAGGGFPRGERGGAARGGARCQLTAPPPGPPGRAAFAPSPFPPRHAAASAAAGRSGRLPLGSGESPLLLL